MSVGVDFHNVVSVSAERHSLSVRSKDDVKVLTLTILDDQDRVLSVTLFSDEVLDVEVTDRDV